MNYFQGESVILHDRKLNIAPAIKKQVVCPTNGAIYYSNGAQTPLSSIPIDQFAATVYPQGNYLYFLNHFWSFQLFMVISINS